MALQAGRPGGTKKKPTSQMLQQHKSWTISQVQLAFIHSGRLNVTGRKQCEVEEWRDSERERNSSSGFAPTENKN